MALARPLPLPLTLTALMLAGTGCTGPPAEVVIDTRVAGSPSSGTEQVLTRGWSTATTISQRWWSGDYRGLDISSDVDTTQPHPSPVSALPAYTPTPAHEPEAFAAQVLALREGPIDEAGTLARNLAAAGPSLWPEIAALLMAERERPKREYKQVLALIGGDVPNRYGHFDLHWKKAHGYDVRVSEDWFEDILRLSPGRISKALRPVYRDVILTTALLRAASAIISDDPSVVDEVVARLLDVAYVHDGTFRDEVGRAIDRLGDPAIAALLRASVPPDRAAEGSTAERRAAYAQFCLDRMDRLHPSRALEAVADNRARLAEVLSAYALVQDGEAAPLLLAHVGSGVPLVRDAAREAFAAYVDGPLPKIRRKSIRLLNGQTTTQRAELSYREHARLAIRDRLARELPELLEPECDLWLTGGIIDRECEGQPARLYAAYLERIDHQRLTRQHALISQALSHDDPRAGVTMLDTLLTDPSVALDADLIAPFFTAVATRVEADGEPEHAARLLRKSALLLTETDGARAQALTVDALLLEAQSSDLDDRGRRMLLTTARELSPDEPRVHAALAGLDARTLASTDTERDALRTALLVLFASLAGLSWIAARLHAKRDAIQPGV